MLEDIFPFLYYYVRRRNLIKTRDLLDEQKKPVVEYLKLAPELLEARLKEEHSRAEKLDEKTFKFTLTISLALTILGSLVALKANDVSNLHFGFFIKGFAAIAVLYILLGGLLALAAIRTLPSYGFGTLAVIDLQEPGEVKRQKLALWLAQQEKTNSIRQIRNEAAYQCIRNGFALILIAIVLFAIGTSGDNRNGATASGVSTSQVKGN